MPIMRVDCWFRLRAMALGRYPSFLAAAKTLARVSEATFAEEAKTRETVA
ncbi:MAG: hypothetical protein ACUVWB_07690 [Anaerolineae bacterium]